MSAPGLPEGAVLCEDPTFARDGNRVYAHVAGYGWVEVRIPPGKPLPAVSGFEDWITTSPTTGAQMRTMVPLPPKTKRQQQQAHEFGEKAKALADLMDFGHGDER